MKPWRPAARRSRRRREANTTAIYVFPWNKPARIQAQDKHAEDAILELTAEVEATLGLRPNPRATLATRRLAIIATLDEQEARLCSLDNAH